MGDKWEFLMKRKIVVLLACILIFSSNTTNVFAANIEPMYVPGFYLYVHSNQYYFKTRDWTHESNNPTSIAQSTTYTVSRTCSSSFSTGVEATIGDMIAKVGISLEVSIGTSTTVSASHTWNIPPHSAYNCIWGSQLVNAVGYQEYYWNNILQSCTYVSGTWSYQSYDNMEYLGYR